MIRQHTGRDDSIFMSMIGPPLGEGGRTLDWEFAESFAEKIDSLYKTEAISEVGERHSYLNLMELKYRKNPEIQSLMSDVNYVLDLVQHKLLIGRGKLTSTDIKVMVRKLKEKIAEETEIKNQKQ